MKEGRQNYTIGNMELGQLNFVLTLLGNRLDELEGRRGTPTFKNVPDMDGNRISNVGVPTQPADALTKDISSDAVIEGTINLFFTAARATAVHDALPGGHAKIIQATNVSDAVGSAVSVASADAGAVYGVPEQGLINELKGDVNQLVTDVNAGLAKLNALLANMRTAAQLV